MKNLQDAEDTRANQFALTVDSNLTGRDTHVIKPGQGAQMFGFTAAPDFAGDDRRGRKDLPQQKPKGGRKGKLVIDDNEFPAL